MARLVPFLGPRWLDGHVAHPTDGTQHRQAAMDDRDELAGSGQWMVGS